ncbi:MAG TPA: GAF domain-containing protein [Anaerolineales bacterium]
MDAIPQGERIEPISTSLRVLLVDDDREDYLLTRDLLSDRSFCCEDDAPVGFELDWAATYADALRAFDCDVYDAYLIDYRLDQRDGLELLREANRQGCKAPVILITGQGSYELDLEAMTSGAADYLSKMDLTAPLLQRTIRYSLERKRTEEALRAGNERLSQAQQELERRVQERTRELASANQELRVLGEAERGQARLAEGLVQAALALNTSLDLDEVLDRILEQTRRVAPCRAVAVMLVEADEVRVARQRGFEDLPELRDRFQGGFPLGLFPQLQEMSQSERPLLVSDTQTDPDWIAVPGQEWVRSYAAAPLHHNGQLIGFLNAFSEQPGFLGPETPARLQAFAAHAAVAIRNARLYQELQNSLDQEKAMRAELLQVEKFAAMGRMIASVAHELNNPLQTIKNVLFLVEQELAPGDISRTYLDMAASETERLSQLVVQLRELYRPQAGQPLEPVSLDALLGEIRFLLEPHFRDMLVRWPSAGCLRPACDRSRSGWPAPKTRRSDRP